MKLFDKIILALIVVLFGITGYQSIPKTPPPNANVLGAFSPAGGLTYRLKSSIGTTNTSVVLTSLKNRSDIPLTMTLMNTSVGYGTLDPQTNSSEFVSFTGITQNADGTATLTGVTRGLSDISPYTASTTLRKSHAGQSIFILSDSPQLFNEYAVKQNDQTVTGLWNFTSAPLDNGTSTSTLQFATRAYVNSISAQGAATSTVNTGGIGILATGAQAAAGTYSSLDSPYFLSTLISTSTRVGTDNNKVVVTKTNDGLLNTLDINFLPRASWLTWTASSTFLGETYIAASTTHPVYFNQISYKFPSTQGASSTVLMNDGSGNLKSYLPQWELLGSTVSDGSGTTTVTLAANTASILKIYFDGRGLTDAVTNLYLRFNGDGSANYGYNLVINNAAASPSFLGWAAANATTSMLWPQYGITPALQFLEATVNNVSGVRKFGNFVGSSFDTAAASANGYILNGNFMWNNTSSAITSVSITTGSATKNITAGSVLKVYGSRD